MADESAPPPFDHFVITEEHAGAPLHSLRISPAEGSLLYSRSGAVVMGTLQPSRRITEWMERHALALAEYNGCTLGDAGARSLGVTIQRGQQRLEAHFRFTHRDELPPPVAALHGEYHDFGRQLAESLDPAAAERMPEVETETRRPWWKLW